MEQRKYRAGVIGLGWMGFLYDLGKRDYERIGGSYQTPIYDVESADRPCRTGSMSSGRFTSTITLDRRGWLLRMQRLFSTGPKWNWWPGPTGTQGGGLCTESATALKLCTRTRRRCWTRSS